MKFNDFNFFHKQSDFFFAISFYFIDQSIQNMFLDTCNNFKGYFYCCKNFQGGRILLYFFLVLTNKLFMTIGIISKRDSTIFVLSNLIIPYAI